MVVLAAAPRRIVVLLLVSGVDVLPTSLPSMMNVATPLLASRMPKVCQPCVRVTLVTVAWPAAFCQMYRLADAFVATPTVTWFWPDLTPTMLVALESRLSYISHSWTNPA